MDSLRTSTAGLARTVAVYPVCDVEDQDTIQAWRDAGAVVLLRARQNKRPGTFAEKVNHAYRQTREPWLFITGDDVRFRPGWLDTAIQTAEHTGAAVVGTNDLANERVIRGDHGTHLLISRHYVDEQGASWDGPGVVCHEGYGHWYVDDEIVTVAKQRDLWASASGSVVEHLHPAGGTVPLDEVYLIGMSRSEHDRMLYARRLATHGGQHAH
jgi:hypothetical protein